MKHGFTIAAALAAALLALAGCSGLEAPVRQGAPAAAANAPPAAGETLSAGEEAAYDPGAEGIASEDSVYFPAGGTQVDERGEQILRRHAARLKERPRQTVTLVGHGDPSSSAAYGLAIAERRLAAVSAALQSLGVARSRIRRAHPVLERGDGGCDSGVCRQRLRRVELRY